MADSTSYIVPMARGLIRVPEGIPCAPETIAICDRAVELAEDMPSSTILLISHGDRDGNPAYPMGAYISSRDSRLPTRAGHARSLDRLGRTIATAEYVRTMWFNFGLKTSEVIFVVKSCFATGMHVLGEETFHRFGIGHVPVRIEAHEAESTFFERLLEKPLTSHYLARLHALPA